MLVEQNDAWSSPLGIETETQLWNHIDHSLDQAKTGLGQDADSVIDNLMYEYAIKKVEKESQ